MLRRMGEAAGRRPTAIITAVALLVTFASTRRSAGRRRTSRQSSHRPTRGPDRNPEPCSGAAIASDLVLTAAHCVLANGKYRLVTFEGRQASVRDVARVVPHPQFSLQTGEFQDLALVKLAASPANLRPAPRPTARAGLFGDRFIVADSG
jgi:hypothetical protein